MKPEGEINAKLQEMLHLDATGDPGLMFSKAATCKTLLWVLGINDDDRWWITSKPGPAVDVRAKDRN